MSKEIKFFDLLRFSSYQGFRKIIRLKEFLKYIIVFINIDITVGIIIIKKSDKNV